MKVLVLLSSYNGSLYIKEQIMSLVIQKDIDLDIYVRDDGSTDNTIKIVSSIKDSYPNITLFADTNVGFVSSFTKLVHKAYLSSHYDYYAFCDQDDIWYDNKLSVAVKYLKEASKNEPVMFCSNSRLIDSEGNPKGGSFVKNNCIINKNNIYLYSRVQGCSMVFNRKALELFHNHPPINCFHDRWISLICATFGEIIYLNEPLFSYRIHSSNTLGMPELKYKGFWELQSSRIKYWLTSSRTKRSRRFEEIISFYESFCGKNLSYNTTLPLAYKASKSTFYRLLLALDTKLLPERFSAYSFTKHFVHVILNRL